MRRRSTSGDDGLASKTEQRHSLVRSFFLQMIRNLLFIRDMGSSGLVLVTLHAPCIEHGGPCRLGVQVLDACRLRRRKASDLATALFIINNFRCSLIILSKSFTARFRHSLIQLACWLPRLLVFVLISSAQSMLDGRPSLGKIHVLSHFQYY